MTLNMGGLQECLSSRKKCAVPIPDPRVRKIWKEESSVARGAPSEGMWEAWLLDGGSPGRDTYVPLTKVFSGGRSGKSGYLFKKTTQSIHTLLFPQVPCLSGKPRSSSASWQRPQWHMTLTASLQLLTQVPERDGNEMCNKHPSPMATPCLSPSVTANDEGDEALH